MILLTFALGQPLTIIGQVSSHFMGSFSSLFKTSKRDVEFFYRVENSLMYRYFKDDLKRCITIGKYVIFFSNQVF